MGAAERIKNTVFPKTYRIFLNFAIYIFIIFLSLSLNKIELVYKLPILISISMVFFLISKSAFYLQDPFMNRPSDTAVTTISRNIEINIKQLLEEENIPTPLKPESFYQL